MVTKTIINPNYPSLYKYLILCALEKRGKHQLCDTVKEPQNANEQDVHLLQKYIDISLSTFEYNKEQQEFIQEIKPTQGNLEIHLSRDYQVIETGNHYVNLAFKIKKDNYINNIIFCVKFKQSEDNPVGDDIIRIGYSRDYVSKFENCTYTIRMNSDLVYYRKCLFNKSININEKIITDLPSEYLFPENYIPKPDLSIEACIIS
jgi:hypothetical protein